MFKGATITYVGNRAYESAMNFRYADITIKANNEDEASFLFENLREYIKGNSSIKCEITDANSCEEYDNYCQYNDSICVYDKDEFDELKALYMTWKKIAKTIIMPVEDVQEIIIVENFQIEEVAPITNTVNTTDDIQISPIDLQIPQTDIMDILNKRVILTLDNSMGNIVMEGIVYDITSDRKIMYIETKEDIHKIPVENIIKMQLLKNEKT